MKLPNIEIITVIKNLKSYEKIIFILLFTIFIILAILRGNAMDATTDFHVFWLAGRNFYLGNRLYLLPDQVLQFIYPPFASLLFGVLVLFQFKTAAISFSVLNIFLWGACFYQSKKIIEYFLEVKIRNIIIGNYSG